MNWINDIPPEHVFAVLFAGVFLVTLRHAWKQIQSRRWKTVTGHLRSSRVDESSDAGGSSFVPRVEYSYKVEGEEYRSDKVGFLTFGSQSLEGARRRLRELRKQKTVRVYYNPNNPRDAVLRPGLTVATILACLTSGFATVYMIGRVWQ